MNVTFGECADNSHASLEQQACPENKAAYDILAAKYSQLLHSHEEQRLEIARLV